MLKVDECVIANELMPSPRFAGLWDSIVAPQELKDRLINQAVLEFQTRPRLPFSSTALHGLLLLYGPPGTGKTTLGRGLAHELTRVLTGTKVRFIEINPHGLMSAEHGQSQQGVLELLGERIPMLADDKKPTIVLLDEVESMAVARSEASLAANPADVHRATDAVLTGLDQLAMLGPNIVVVATSNFTAALDDAFKSRADCALELPMPSPEALHQILEQTLEAFAAAFPDLSKLAHSKQLTDVAKILAGCDGRRARKVVTEAMCRRRETVLDPGKLTIADLKAAAKEHAR